MALFQDFSVALPERRFAAGDDGLGVFWGYRRALELLGTGRIIRLHEMVDAGIAATTVARMARAGEITRLGRGLYQAADAPFGGDHTLLEVAKAVPKGVICLLSALAFHELTDQIPTKVWVAVGLKDWKPSPTGNPLKFQATVDLGRANSRMKDFYDVWLLATSFRFEDDRLVRAIAATFARARPRSRQNCRMP